MRRFLRLATEFLLLLILAASALIAGELLVRTSIWHAIALIAGELLGRTSIWHANIPFFCLQAGERES